MHVMPKLFTAALIALSSAPAFGQQAEPEAQPADVPFAAAPIDEAALQSVAGREDTTQAATNEQRAGVSQNSVGNNSVTGEARIDGNAFQNMSGLSILNVNTGNNVAINAAMNVNISLSPGQ